MTELEKRRANTKEKMQKLRDNLGQAELLAFEKACVYATGSFGRGEAGENSDLDLFIVGLSKSDSTSKLNRLDEICIKADLLPESSSTLI